MRVLLSVAAAALGLAQPTIEIRSHPTEWVAPGAAFSVSGYAGSQATVELLVDGRPVAKMRSGPLGRFDLKAHAPGAGRHALSIRSGHTRVSAGALVVRPLTLAAVGDVTPGEAVGPAVEAHGGAYPWAFAGARLRRADIATANLEGAITTRGAEATKKYRFRGPVAVLTGAQRFGGLDVVTLANNHSLDFGSIGLADTLAAARRAGLATVGAGGNAAAARRAAIIEAGGLRVAFLGYSDVNPLGFAAGATSPGTARAETGAIAEDVRAARRRSDLVVVWFHWGVELHGAPTGAQTTLARAALDAGATAVLGAHPHVLGPVERPRPGRLVAWSLGNFVFPAGSGATVRTAVLEVRLGARGVLGYDLVPAHSGVQPTLAH